MAKTPSKKSAKAPKKDSGGEKKKGKRKAKETFSSYIHKVMKHVHPDHTMSSKAMSCMNSLVMDIFERIGSEAGKCVRYEKEMTLSGRAVQSAIRLVLPGELSKHAVSEGTKAVSKYEATLPPKEKKPKKSKK